ncbi:deleted in malignant brain tumors 1 protein [Megalobrama amblycephala]|uniref:deleted in malignant brain tumors 1 protein n=1 Tax=Megalobrama amblycephala TaxID=75352 RepID=UPI002013FA16|nr:deleted in malignant brain tumors 1 protein [Megalobrama amblycephala]
MLVEHFTHKRHPFFSLEVRLIDGDNSCSGRVEVLYEGYGWGTVCDDGWNLLGGDVICKQVNCGSGLSVVGGSFFNKGSGSIWVYDTACSGTEISLKSCISGTKSKQFPHNNDAGVICREAKLVNGTNICSGTVQIRYSGDWGTVCDNNWDLLDGLVLCRELGCGPLTGTYAGAYFGIGSGNILMDNLLCTGSESSLEECQFSGLADSLCTHSQDAGVICGEVRLVNGGSSCSGRVEVLRDNQWGTVCGDSWDMTDAEVVCRELGCGSPVEVKTDGYFGSGIGPIWMDDVKCTGTETSVKNCKSNGWGEHNCVHAKDAGVICREVKLVNTNNTCQGTVQVFHDGRWGTVCHNSWDIADGLVLCRELGCGGNAEPLTNAHFGAGEGPIWMDSLRCSGDESNLRKCQFDGWGNHQCIHAYDAGIICREIRNVLRIKVNADSVNPNEPSHMTKLLDKIKKEVEKNGNFSVKWRAQPNGQVFQEQKLFDP